MKRHPGGVPDAIKRCGQHIGRAIEVLDVINGYGLVFKDDRLADDEGDHLDFRLANGLARRAVFAAREQFVGQLMRGLPITLVAFGIGSQKICDISKIWTRRKRGAGYSTETILAESGQPRHARKARAFQIAPAGSSSAANRPMPSRR